ncbi:hypothetical protein [Roseateles chitinivorans]|uniref:hypothetical protein n=1 Tax=Roseateles chitinivorans TaxID=2917965 RepID=UPI003D67471B
MEPGSASIDAERIARADALRRDFDQAAFRRLEMACCRQALGDPVEYPAPDDGSWAATNATAAQEALQAIREALHDLSLGSPAKSTNKWPRHACTDPREFPTATLNVKPSQAELADDPAAAARYAYAKASMEAWRGMKRNCSALCRAAQDYLARHFPKVQISTVHFREDHAMLVVGSLKPTHAGRPLSLWPRHLYVCDPWANISGPANEYPERFRQKMTKWESDGKRLISKHKGGRGSLRLAG